MLDAPLHCPLNEGHCDQINQALTAINHARKYCEDCQAARIDMSGYLATLKDQEDALTGIKAKFFPHRS